MRCFECGIDFENDLRVCQVCGRPLETDADKYFKAAMDSIAAQDMHEALVLLLSCVEQDPEHLSGRYNLGMMLSLAGRCEDAMEHFRTVADRDPAYPGIHTALGQAAFGSYLMHQEEAESRSTTMIECFKQAVERDAHDVDAYFSLGNAYIAMNKPDEALSWLKCALMLDPNASATYLAMAKAFRMAGKYREAAIMARKSFQLSQPGDQLWEDIQNTLSELQQGTMPI